MGIARKIAILAVLLSTTVAGQGQQITAAGQPAQLDIRTAGERTLRVTIPAVFEGEPCLPPIVSSSWEGAGGPVATSSQPHCTTT